MKEEFKCYKKGDQSEVRRFLILSTPSYSAFICHTGELLRALQYSTILSQQNKGVIGTFKLHNIYKRFTITVVSDLRK